MAALVVVGASLGGVAALQVLLSELPATFAPPLVVVQHRGRASDDGLARLLQARSPLPVCEPDDKQRLEGGHVYLAPADYHVLVERGALALSTDGPVQHARPSIDVLFESAADAYGRETVGVILTGANRDGAQGCARIKERGGVVLVQDPADAESRFMPAAAIAAAHVDKILPLGELGPFLADVCRAKGGPQRS